MLTLALLVPLLGAFALLFPPNASEQQIRRVAIGVAAVPLLLLLVVWARFDTGAGAPAFQQVQIVPWIPSLGVAGRVRRRA